MSRDESDLNRSWWWIALASVASVTGIFLAAAWVGGIVSQDPSNAPSVLPDPPEVYAQLADRGWMISTPESPRSPDSTDAEAVRAAQQSFGFLREATPESVALVNATIKRSGVSERLFWLVHFDNVAVPLFGSDGKDDPGVGSIFVLVDPNTLEIFQARSF
jgi:hypothetical protein